MPYYYAIVDNTVRVRGERETYVGAVHDTPMSLVRKYHIGPRSHGLVGKKLVTIEVLSHDGIKVTANGKVTLDLIKHRDYEEGGDDKLAITLSNRDIISLSRTSLSLRGRLNEQVRWSENMETSGEDFVDFLGLETLKDVLRGKK